MGDESEWKKAPTEDKCEHKNWKARLEGYEECCKLFRLADDPKNPMYLNYLGLVKKFVIDSNEVAKEKGLEAVLAFIENIPAAAKSVGEVMPGLINKCLNGRVKTREKAIEIIMMYIEAEKQEIVQEELIKGLDNKQPKIVQACLEILRRAINEFSSKTMPIKPVIKFVPKLLEDRDKIVRDETKLLAIEMYRWAGAAIMPQLQGYKLLDELEAEFKATVGEKPRQTRFLRSQQDLKAKMEAENENRLMSGSGSAIGNSDSNGANDCADSAMETIDPYDLMEPADIISKLPKDFKEKLEAKKWQERKEVLDALLTLMQKNPRLVVTDYYEIVNDLQKLVNKDANVNIVVVAAKCLAGIANGIRKDFSKYSSICISPLMERFKEKKQNVVDALREALDAIYPSTNLENISETSVAFLAHKTPVVRQQVALFLARCFTMSTQTTLPKKVLKLYLAPLTKNLSEADPAVRETSAEALGAILKALGEKIFLPQLGELEQIKMDKIKEFADKTILLNLKGEPRSGGASAQAVATKPTAAAAPIATKSGPTIKKPDTKPTSAKPAADTKKEVKKVVKGGADNKKATIPEEPDLSQETVEERAAEIFGTECCTGLSSNNWKERQQAIETITNKIKVMPSDEVPVQVIIRTLARKPGFKDTHFQVLKQRLELVAVLADVGFKFSQRSASYCLADVADKIGDVKTGQQAKDALSKIAEQTSLPYVCLQILPAIFEGKNPKNQENVLIWLAQAIKEFGFQGFEMKFLLTYIKTALANNNAAVRVGSIQLIGTVHMYAGPSFRSLFDQEKAALLEQMDTEIEKVKGIKAPVPIRGKNVPGAASASNGESNGNADEEEDDLDPIKQQLKQESLMPRTDISNELTDTLMDQLNEKNWKERQAALEKLEQILRDNKFIEPNLSEFPTHLNKRFTDTNKILATTSLKLSEKLAAALGSQGKRYVSVLAPGMIQALSDNKEALRKTAVSALNAWFDNCGGLAPFLEGDLLLESFTAATNPNIKAELCGWLCNALPKSKPGKLPPELKAIIPSVFAYVEDRSQEVRVKAQELILPLMTHIGPNDMLRAMQKAKPTSITILQPLIEKARAELAARAPPPPPPKAAAAPPPAAASKAPVKAVKQDIYADSSDDFNDQMDTPAPPAAAVSKQEPKKAVNGKATGKEAPAKGGSAASTSKTAGKKGAEEEEIGPIIQISNKNKRMEEERSLKTLKWNFDVPRKEFVEQLKSQIETAGFNRTLINQLFHDDFKLHINALNSLTKAVEELQDATISNLDLILRWLSLRFFETNPTVIHKAIEYMLTLFTMLSVRNHHLTDYEANSFVPYFIGKLGDPKDTIRKGFRQIIKQISQVYAPVKVYNFLIQGLVSKNARQRAECLEEIGQMIEILGLNTFNPSVTLKEIAKQIGDRDNSVRNAALNTITISFQIAGEPVYKYIGKLNEKDQSMLEERIKRSSKQAPSAAIQQAQNGVKQSISSIINPSTQTTTIPNSNSLQTIPSQQQQQSKKEEQNNSSFTEENNPNKSLNNGINSRTMTRPNTTPKKIKQQGEFRLDLKDDDDDQNGYIPVKLTPHQDLDELLNQPIGLPPPRTKVIQYPISILKESQDCKEAIDLVITHISHQKLDISFQNLIQIDVVIKDREKKDLLIPHIDNLLNTCAVKLNVAHNVYLNSHDCQIDEVFKLFKGLFSVIMDVFENDLGKYASVKTLKDLIYNLLCVMIDSKILNYAEGEQLIKAINMVTLKLLELSNQTTSYCALVKLLNECCDQENSYLSSKYLELVMKCIWRQIRRLSSNGTTPQSPSQTDTLIQQIDTSKVLQEIHTFLQLYPSSSWQSKQSDLPLRTVKTLLFHLAKAKQSQIIDDLNSINVDDDSEIKIYITKLFKNGFQLANANTTPQSNSSFGFTKKESLKQSPQLPNDQLSSIIKKIGNSEQSKEGLRELYDFKQQHPDIDLNKYFKNSSGKLQAYIQENLKLIEQERSTKSLNLISDNSITNNAFISRNLAKNILPLKDTDSDFKPTANSRNVDDIMKTIADWKSKTHLNKLDDDDNDENNLRTVSSNDYSSKSNNLTSKLNQLSSNHFANIGNGSNFNHDLESSPVKAEKYLDIVKDYKKKYTRSRTESDQLNDFKQLDLKSKNMNENSASNSNLNSLRSDLTSDNSLTSASISSAATTATTTSNSSSTPYSQMPSENLYDEYKRRLELIKKIKQIK